jgi:hypothetical protein
MWLRSSISLLVAACSLPYVAADRYLSSTSLATCQEDSLITASLFDVTFFPGNDTIYYDINANASVTGNVSMTLQVIAYGYYLQPIDINPCDGSSLSTNFCPIETAGEPIDLQASSPVPADIVSRVPGTKESPSIILVITNKTKESPILCQILTEKSRSSLPRPIKTPQSHV